MPENEKLLKILEENGMSASCQYGGKAPQEITEREIKKEPHENAKKLREIYYQTLSTADTEFSYWYTRTWKENEGEVPIIRRALALSAAFSHITPNILPDEKILMQKTRNYRGSFPMPWLSESFFVAKEEELSKEAAKKPGNSADELSKFGSGGGNVTKSFGNVVSIAGKFGMRKEEIPALLRLAREWEGKSVEDLGHRYENMIPGAEIKDELMRSLICMFDSGYTLPLGREVINYYYPLQYGFEGIKKMAFERMEEVAGNASGNGINGMDRLYFYRAVIIIIEGIQRWILNKDNAYRQRRRWFGDEFTQCIPFG